MIGFVSAIEDTNQLYLTFSCYLYLAAKIDQVQSILRHHVIPDKNLLITALESGELDTLNEDTARVMVSSSFGDPPVVTVEGADVIAWNFIAVSAKITGLQHQLMILKRCRLLVQRCNPRHRHRPFARRDHTSASKSNRKLFNGWNDNPQVFIRT